MREYNNVIIKLIDNKISDFKQSCEDVAVEVAEKIILKSTTEREDIGVLLYVTQSPRFMTPSTSFYIHKQLKLGKECFQYDVNQGSTGFSVGLQLIISLMQGFDIKKKGLLLIGDSDPEYGSRAAGLLIEHTNDDNRIYICNCSYGKYFKKFFCHKGEVCLEDSFVSLGKKYLSEELQRLSDYAEKQNIQINQILGFENQYRSSTEVIEKLCEMKPNGNVILGTFGAGISVVTSILYLNKDMYL